MRCEFKVISALVALLCFAITTEVWAASDGARILSVNRTVKFSGVDQYIGETSYEIADFFFVKRRDQGGNVAPKGDGWIDSAVVSRTFTKADSSAIQSQFPRGIVFPVKAEVYYYRPDKKDSTFFRGTKEQWLAGFHSQFRSCTDAHGRTVRPIGGKWNVWSVTADYMKYLHKVYDYFYFAKAVEMSEITSIHSIKKTIALVTVNQEGQEAGYELIDVSRGGERGDGWIDEAYIANIMPRPNSSIAKKFPAGTTFPLSIKTFYFHAGNEISQNFLNLNEVDWLGEFSARIVLCVDARGLNVPAPKGRWKTGRAQLSLLQKLQRLYDENQ